MRGYLIVLAIVSAGCSILAEDQSSGLPSVPYPIPGMPAYGYVVTEYTQDEQMLMQLVRASGDSTDADYHVVDSFTCIDEPGPCGGNSISYVTQEDSCFHVVTLGPLPDTEKDTVISSCIESRYWTMYQHFLVKSEALFACAVTVPGGGPVKSWRCVIGRIGEDRQIDTVACIQGGFSCRLLPDGTEVSVGVRFSPDEHNFAKMTLGIYDLLANELLMPLDTTCPAWAGYRASRDEPLYYIKNHLVHGVNVWRWDEDWGEELVTFFSKPEVVRTYALTADSLICVVVMESDSASTGVTRVAVPINPE
ncbi:MAG: hypothetical protein GY867_09335 [bacterium]|nr:hypothetical protein [bacterium]